MVSVVWETGGVLIGLVRPRESRSLQVQGDSLEEVRQHVDELIPEGFELASMPVRMSNGHDHVDIHSDPHKTRWPRRDPGR